MSTKDKEILLYLYNSICVGSAIRSAKRNIDDFKDINISNIDETYIKIWPCIILYNNYKFIIEYAKIMNNEENEKIVETNTPLAINELAKIYNAIKNLFTTNSDSDIEPNIIEIQYLLFYFIPISIETFTHYTYYSDIYTIFKTAINTISSILNNIITNNTRDYDTLVDLIKTKYTENTRDYLDSLKNEIEHCKKIYNKLLHYIEFESLVDCINDKNDTSFEECITRQIVYINDAISRWTSVNKTIGLVLFNKLNTVTNSIKQATKDVTQIQKQEQVLLDLDVTRTTKLYDDIRDMETSILEEGMRRNLSDTLLNIEENATKINNAYDGVFSLSKSYEAKINEMKDSAMHNTLLNPVLLTAPYDTTTEQHVKKIVEDINTEVIEKYNKVIDKISEQASEYKDNAETNKNKVRQIKEKDDHNNIKTILENIGATQEDLLSLKTLNESIENLINNMKEEKKLEIKEILDRTRLNDESEKIGDILKETTELSDTINGILKIIEDENIIVDKKYTQLSENFDLLKDVANKPSSTIADIKKTIREMKKYIWIIEDIDGDILNKTASLLGLESINSIEEKINNHDTNVMTIKDTVSKALDELNKTLIEINEINEINAENDPTNPILMRTNVQSRMNLAKIRSIHYTDKHLDIPSQIIIYCDTYIKPYHPELINSYITEKKQNDKLEMLPFIIRDIHKKYNIFNTSNLLMLMGLISDSDVYKTFVDDVEVDNIENIIQFLFMDLSRTIFTKPDTQESQGSQGSQESQSSQESQNLQESQNSQDKEFISMLNIEHKFKRDTLVYKQYDAESSNIILTYTLIKTLMDLNKTNTIYSKFTGDGMLTMLIILCNELLDCYDNILNIFSMLESKRYVLKKHYSKMIQNKLSIFTYLKIRATHYHHPRYIANKVGDSLEMIHYNSTKLSYEYGSSEKEPKEKRDERKAAVDAYEVTDPAIKENYHFGSFEKIFESADTSAMIAVELFNKFKHKIQNFESICIIGYGQSGAGKTCCLINRGNIKGIILDLLSIIGSNIAEITEVRLEGCDIYSNHSKRFDPDIYSDAKNDIEGTYSKENNNDYIVKHITNNKTYRFKPSNSWTHMETNGNITALDIDIIGLLSQREIAPTVMNPNSSRSHLIIILTLSSGSSLNKQCNIVLCDLAGYENIIDCMDKTKLDLLTGSYKDTLIEKDKYFTDQCDMDSVRIHENFNKLANDYHNNANIVDKIIEDTQRIYSKFESSTGDYFSFFLTPAQHTSIPDLSALLDKYKDHNNPNSSLFTIVSDIARKITTIFNEFYNEQFNKYFSKTDTGNINNLLEKINNYLTNNTNTNIIDIYNFFEILISEIFKEFITFLIILNNGTNNFTEIISSSNTIPSISNILDKHIRSFEFVTYAMYPFNGGSLGRVNRKGDPVNLKREKNDHYSTLKRMDGDIFYDTKHVDKFKSEYDEPTNYKATLEENMSFFNTISADEMKKFYNDIKSSINYLHHSVKVTPDDNIPYTAWTIKPNLASRKSTLKKIITDNIINQANEQLRKRLYGILHYKLRVSNLILITLIKLNMWFTCFKIFNNHVTNKQAIKYNCMLRNNENPNASLYKFYNDIKFISKGKLYKKLNSTATSSTNTKIDYTTTSLDLTSSTESVFTVTKDDISTYTYNIGLTEGIIPYMPIYCNKNIPDKCINNNYIIDNYEEYYKFYNNTSGDKQLNIFNRPYGIIMNSILKYASNINLLTCNFIIFSFIDLSDVKALNNPPKPPYINISDVTFMKKLYTTELNNPYGSPDTIGTIMDTLTKIFISLYDKLRNHEYYESESIYNKLKNIRFNSLTATGWINTINETLKTININNSVTLIGILENSDTISNIEDELIICDDISRIEMFTKMPQEFPFKNYMENLKNRNERKSDSMKVGNIGYIKNIISHLKINKEKKKLLLDISEAIICSHAEYII